MSTVSSFSIIFMRLCAWRASTPWPEPVDERLQMLALQFLLLLECDIQRPPRARVATNVS